MKPENYNEENMMKKTMSIIAAMGCISAFAALRSITPSAPTTSEWWMNRHATLLERAKCGNGKIVFLGDSITHGWEGAGKAVWESISVAADTSPSTSASAATVPSRCCGA